MKGYAYQLGLDPQSFGGHSLRAGCATYLLDQEIQPAAVQKQLRHKRFDTTQRYNRGETARALVGAYWGNEYKDFKNLKVWLSSCSGSLIGENLNDFS